MQYGRQAITALLMVLLEEEDEKSKEFEKFKELHFNVLSLKKQELVTVICRVLKESEIYKL